ncbi:MAG TPA: nitroreductase family protein [Candidatus Coproplasma stercorigallinarum]|nr:nitroreductase family protein [Candidatus Coproplasma stercorigallinarum]
MDIEKLFLTRQSTRRYSEQPVSDEELERICRLGALAPSAKNSQPWKMFAISGEKAKDFACCVQMFGANKWASGCPAFIAIELKRGKLAEKIAEKFTFADFAGNDIGLLTAYITLAAEDMGLQTCILGIRDEKKIAAFVGEPEGSRFPLIIAVGHAEEGYPVREKDRKPFDEVYKLIK